jgi:hypothetical protein
LQTLLQHCDPQKSEGIAALAAQAILALVQAGVKGRPATSKTVMYQLKEYFRHE